mgnify:CR=1 FL=1|tara:strand:- start:582 stop:917 length:336 start_codon:yes stop_codon:yes gene_type:complete
MRVLLFSLFIFLSGCGVLKRAAPPLIPNPNPAPQAHREIEFSKIDVNNDGTVTKEEVEKFNEIVGSADEEAYGPWIAAKWFFLIIALICVACCGPWASSVVKKKVESWKSD